MNAFPAELIQHHYACMLVAGLLPEANSAQRANQSSKGSSPETMAKKEAESSNAVQMTRTSSTTGTSIPLSPAATFPQLAQDLCDIFTSRGRSTAWDPAKSKSAVFHSILVDHNVRLPPRKTRPTPRTLTATPQGHPGASNGGSLASSAAALPPQSPLSPLHPSSPLFPDGLIAPIWLRKHRELVPSVFVAFYCLTEHGVAPPPTPPKDGMTRGEDPQSQAVEDGEPSKDPIASAKASDEALVKAITSRKRVLSERGIKFTVVLLTTRAMLESTSLEQRLSFIRRSSQLDTRASLFVLTPVSKEELSEFVTSLQTALYEPAMDYYREHYRRARRKRTRYPPPASLVTQIFAVASELRGSPIKDRSLSKEGWTARNEYKLGTFAELTGALDEALSHYTSAYQIIASQLLTSTFLLPPRTKRWAEAKVLADTLSFRISKLLLYRNDGVAAWEHYRSHIRRFTELSQGWGIGEMTFEFWSWLGKQYRLMGDLLELATREVPGSPLPPFKRLVHFPPMPTMLLHPSHLPTPSSTGGVASTYNSQYGNLAAPNDAAMASYALPSSMCPSPGECYYIAGICALERWERFQKLLWEEQQGSSALPQEDGKDNMQGEQNWSSTSLAHEKKIDHAGQAVEVLSRAHEIFKRHRDQRSALFVASKIVDAYIQSDQLQLALRFLERISRSYEEERWPAPLTSQLLKALHCAQQTQDSESEGRALWQLAGIGEMLGAEQRTEAATALRTWCESGAISEEKRPLLMEYAHGEGPFDVAMIFSDGQANLDGEASPFQLRVTSRSDISLEGIRFDRLVMHFQDSSDVVASITVNHAEEGKDTYQIGTIDLRVLSEQAPRPSFAMPLSWSTGSCLLIEGSLIPRCVGRLQLNCVAIERDGHAAFSLKHTANPFDADSSNRNEEDFWCISTHPTRYVTLPRQSGSRTSLDVQRRECKIGVEVGHASEAYLDERCPLLLKLTNEDVIPFECVVDVHVMGPPGEVISADEVWTDAVSDAAKVSVIRDLQVGQISPASSVSTIVYVRCREHLALRSIDIVIRSRSVNQGENADEDWNETVKSILLPVKALFASAFSAQWQLFRDKESQYKAKESLQINGTGAELVQAGEGGAEKMEEMPLRAVTPDELPFISSLASLNVSLSVAASTSIELLDVGIALDEHSKYLQLTSSNGQAGQGSSLVRQTEVVGGIWSQGDRWGCVFDIEATCEAKAGTSVELEDGGLRPTGVLLARWRRALTGADANEDQPTENISLIPLPILLPPHLLSRLIVTIPSSLHAEQSLVMLLTVVNPSRLAVDVLVGLDDSRSDFGNPSHRTISVPNLLPKSTRNVPVQLLARSHVQMGVSSIRTLPLVRAWQRDRRRYTSAAAITADAVNSRRTSIESAAASQAPSVSMAVSSSGAGRAMDFTPIVNHRSGAGVPLDVMLRYSTKTANATREGEREQAGQVHTDRPVAAIERNDVTNDLNAHLQTETQRTGLWTIFVN